MAFGWGGGKRFDSIKSNPAVVKKANPGLARVKHRQQGGGGNPILADDWRGLEAGGKKRLKVSCRAQGRTFGDEKVFHARGEGEHGDGPTRETA